ncbi:hypothetical protein BJY52DRAFT_1420186 [Lactarius psammicola]|nr:hypothetical protein BJY52DRAFT_1420186 [Lactarius psammicola]
MTLSANWLEVIGGPVPRTADILGASYQPYQHVGTKNTVLRTVPNPRDLTKFTKESRIDGEDATFTVVQVNSGGNDPSDLGAEANLDVQFAGTTTFPIRNNLLQHKRVLFATGDEGVGKGACLVRLSSGGVRFLLQLPASYTCPYVTSVGGTKDENTEVAVILSGGDFSNYRESPAPYLKSIGDKYEGLFNLYGRGLSDISAVIRKVARHEFRDARASFLPFFCRSPPSNTRLTAQRTNNGSIGLPGLNGITSGTNPGCRTNRFAGWDPVYRSRDTRLYEIRGNN